MKKKGFVYFDMIAMSLVSLAITFSLYLIFSSTSEVNASLPSKPTTEKSLDLLREKN